MRLDFETILGILFFVVFFILPAFNRKKKAPSEAAPQRPAQEGAPAEVRGQPVNGAPAEQASAQPRPTHRPPPATRGAAKPGTFEEALEEIRARVREAQLNEDAQRGARGAKQKQATVQQPAAKPPPQRGRLVRADPFGGSLVSGEASHISGRTGPTGTATPGTQAQQRRPRPVPGGLGREGVAEPLAVTRRVSGTTRASARAGKRDLTSVDALPGNAPSTATLAAQGLSMNRQALLTGMIWHEILSEPVATRRRRRTKSRPR